MKILIYSCLLILLNTTCLSAQSKDFKNTLELSAFASPFIDLVEESSTWQGFLARGILLKYKREVYADNINKLSVGITTQYIGARLDIYNFSHIGPSYFLLSNQNIQSIGLALSNRFSIKRKKYNYFIDAELSVMHPYIFKQSTRLSEHGQESWGSGTPIEFENGIATNWAIAYISIQGGIQFPSFEKLFPYLAIGLSQNINSFYKETSIPSLTTPIKSFHYLNLSLVLGSNF